MYNTYGCDIAYIHVHNHFALCVFAIFSALVEVLHVHVHACTYRIHTCDLCTCRTLLTYFWEPMSLTGGKVLLHLHLCALIEHGGTKWYVIPT